MSDISDSTNQRSYSQLLNPYTLPQDDLVRLQVWVDPADKYYLTSIYPMRGIETYMVCTLYKQVCSELRAHNITSYTPDNARLALELITRHIAPLSPSGERSLPNDKGGGDEVHKPHSHSADLPTNILQTAKGGRGSSGGRGRSSSEATKGKKGSGGKS